MSSEEVAELRSQAAKDYGNGSYDTEHHFPLILFFKVEAFQKNSPIIVLPQEPFRASVVSSGTSYSAEGNYAMSWIRLSKDRIRTWPEEMAFEVTYSVEEPQVISTRTTLGETPVEIGPNITLCFDDKYVGSMPTGTPRTPGWTNLVFRYADRENVRMQAKMYFKSGKSEVLYTMTTRGEGDKVIREDISHSFAAEDFDRVEVTRQKFARKKIGKVKVRPDLSQTDR